MKEITTDNITPRELERLLLIEKTQLHVQEVKEHGGAVLLMLEHAEKKAFDALAPLGPELFCNYTKEEWQQVIDLKCDVHDTDRQFWCLDVVDFNSRRPFYYGGKWHEICNIRQELAHIRPYFKRLGIPDIASEVPVVILYKGVSGHPYSTGSKTLTMMFNDIKWDQWDVRVVGFIQ